VRARTGVDVYARVLRVLDGSGKGCKIAGSPGERRGV
jgi:hypothetical protein